MKSAYSIHVFLWLALVFPLHANGEQHANSLPLVGVSIATRGETVLLATSGSITVRVRIRTHEVQNGTPSSPTAASMDLGCTNSRFPCSLVGGLEIFVNDKPLFVPRSVFCDLADLNKGAIKIRQKTSMLTLVGGDASESYIVKIEFDVQGVKRRTLSSFTEPNEPLQETVYYSRTVGN
jgi:hypothetical protein